MRNLKLAAMLAAGALLAASATAPARASDHADTAENYNRIGADMTDVFLFPSNTNAGNVVVVMDVHGLIPAGMGPDVAFDPGVLYQIKFDVTGDYVEDLVIQARFVGTGANQKVLVAGPFKPATTGTTAIFGRPHPTTGTINTAFTPAAGMQVFAGVRADPFFFDLNQFYQILPDRMTPLTGKQVNFPSIMAADTPQKAGFTAPGSNYFADLNVLSIIVELPRAMLAPAGEAPGVVHLWETTSLSTGAPNFNYQQQDRLARPAINEALATVTANRHTINNKDNPTDDAANLKTDILAFMNFPAGRSAAIANALAGVLVPDVMTADLSQAGPAAYLGYETGGFTEPTEHSTFGGRKLTDDVVDIDLMSVFGAVIPMLKLAPDDGKELDGRNGGPVFTTDFTGPTDAYLNAFPYLGEPH